MKIREQLGESADKDYDYLFSENGLMAFKKGELLKATSFKDHLGEERLKKLINFILIYVANLDIPIKRGKRESRSKPSGSRTRATGSGRRTPSPPS